MLGLHPRDRWFESSTPYHEPHVLVNLEERNSIGPAPIYESLVVMGTPHESTTGVNGIIAQLVRVSKCRMHTQGRGSNPSYPTMNETIVIRNPSPELLKFIGEQQKRKKEVMDEVCKTYRNTEVFLKALETYGFEAQRMMVIEECSELMNVLAKHVRGRCQVDEIITELADVAIMVEQMALHFGYKEFLDERQRKIERLNERLNK